MYLMSKLCRLTCLLSVLALTSIGNADVKFDSDKQKVWDAVSEGVDYESVKIGTDSYGDAGIVYRRSGGGWGFERFKSMNDVLSWILAQNGGACPEPTSTQGNQAVQTIASVILQLGFLDEGKKLIQDVARQSMDAQQQADYDCLVTIINYAVKL